MKLLSWPIVCAMVPVMMVQVGLAEKHIAVSESMGMQSMSGSIVRNVFEPLSVAMHLESFDSPTLSGEWSIRTSYYLEEQRLARIGLGYGRIFYLSNIGRAETKSDTLRTWRETEPLSYGLFLGLEGGRQVLRSFPSLGETEAVAEYAGVRLGGRLLTNLSDKYAPMLSLSLCYNYGFGRFPFTGIIIEGGVAISFPW